MAAMQGQPEPKPGQVGSPVPKVGFDSLDGPAPAIPTTSAQPGGSVGFDSLDQAAPAQAAPAASNALVDPSSLAGRALQTTANVAPEGLGIAGGIVGRAAGIPGMTAMGMTGAAAGMGYRQFIEQDILGKPGGDDPDKNLNEIKNAAGKVGAELLAGEVAIRGAARGGALALETKIGQAFAGKVTATVKPVVDYISNFADTLKKSVIAPATEWLEQNMAQGTSEQSGDAIKGKIMQAVQPAYDAFKQRYATINSVAADTVMSDATRLKLSSGIRDDARGLPSNLYRLAKTYADKVDAGANAADIHEMISGVDEEIQRLSQRQTSSAIRDKLGALQQISERATDFMENQTYGIAKRIASGGATMPEMDAFGKMMAQQAHPSVPLSEANLPAYAKSVAKDYIKQREGLTQAYAQFRGGLEDLGEQTGVKVQGFGPMQIMNKIDALPSEELVERMFLPKNAAALRNMAETAPDTFQLVKQARVRDIYNQSMTEGRVDRVDLQKLVNNFKALDQKSESARQLIISDAELAKLQSVAKQGSLSALNRLHDNVVTNFIRGTLDLTRAGTLAGAKIAKDTYGKDFGKVLADRVAGAAVGAAAPGGQAPPQEPQP